MGHGKNVGANEALARWWIAAPHPRRPTVREMEVPQVGQQTWPGFATLGYIPPPPATAKNSALAEGEAIGKKATGGGSGRSFANRCGRGDNDSKTLVFGRACNRPTPSTRNNADESTNLLLPRERDTSRNNAPCETVADLDILEGGAQSVIPVIKEPCSNENDADLFPCKYCSRSFREHRPLRNHMASFHPNFDEVGS